VSTLKPVSIMWSQGVDTAEARVAVSAVREFLRLVYVVGNGAGLALPPIAIRPFGTWYIPSVPEGSPYWGTTWYIDTSFDALRQQVVGAKFLSLVREEPWQKSSPHWDVALIDRDLTDSETVLASSSSFDFVLGTSVPELAAVLSVYRLRGLVRGDLRELALRRLVFHYFGQILGLPSRSRREEIGQVDGRRFCTNQCVMRYAPTVDQVVRAAEQEKRDAVSLCAHCRHDLIELILMRGRSPN
jgi:predicted Zn-dependent protease